jgi:hypothetical protein
MANGLLIQSPHEGKVFVKGCDEGNISLKYRAVKEGFFVESTERNRWRFLSNSGFVVICWINILVIIASSGSGITSVILKIALRSRHAVSISLFAFN